MLVFIFQDLYHYDVIYNSTGLHINLFGLFFFTFFFFITIFWFRKVEVDSYCLLEHTCQKSHFLKMLYFFKIALCLSHYWFAKYFWNIYNSFMNYSWYSNWNTSLHHANDGGARFHHLKKKILCYPFEGNNVLCGLLVSYQTYFSERIWLKAASADYRLVFKKKHSNRRMSSSERTQIESDLSSRFHYVVVTRWVQRKVLCTVHDQVHWISFNGSLHPR